MLPAIWSINTGWKNTLSRPGAPQGIPQIANLAHYSLRVYIFMRDIVVIIIMEINGAIFEKINISSILVLRIPKQNWWQIRDTY